MTKRQIHQKTWIGVALAGAVVIAGVGTGLERVVARGFGGFHGGFHGGGFGGFHGGFGGFHGGFGGFHGGFGGFHGGSRFGDGGFFDRGGDEGFGRGGFGSVHNAGSFAHNADSFARNHPEFHQDMASHRWNNVAANNVAAWNDFGGGWDSYYAGLGLGDDFAIGAAFGVLPAAAAAIYANGVPYYYAD